MLLEKRVPFLYLFKQIKYDLLFVFLMSVCTFSLKKLYGEQMPKIPVSLPAFLGTAISLLLSFKLSQSYDRWWEARKVWGAIVNDSRTMVLQLLNFSASDPKEDGLATKKTMSYRQIAWAYCLGQSLRNLDVISKAKEFISEADILYIEMQKNKPLALLNLQTKNLAELYTKGCINSFQEIQINNTLVELTNSMGKAERINNTVFPVTYRQILHLFIYIFLAIMSLALLEIDSLWEIPLDLVIALPFFMIEKTATYMQDPFMNKPTDTAITSIANTIETNIKQLWQDNDLPDPVDSKDAFYIL
ncbi:bestrophin family protein [Arachidicoccus soli]|uniref:Bestrophin n=1 Tax=Arachidicoccus soli TaxID=2341117 RepID=A0A386HMZ2_9BACT|nr:bestrophin family ion channel [Arachidicoccus soli]AYD47267.1 hypothetical protein D6B99_06375 [Arachidicoccus soli]